MLRVIDHGSQRRALAFCVDVAHSVALSEAFTSSGIRSAAVYGDMDKDDRRNILRQFEAGELQVVTNCNLLTEGYDHPEVACILMARPTQSLTLYTQCIGRGTRLHPGKQDCLVIDYTDNCHDIGSIVSLQKAVPVPAVERSDKEAIKAPPQKKTSNEASISNTKRSGTSTYSNALTSHGCQSKIIGC
jgi:superfamily II DNA or RNA helicase